MTKELMIPKEVSPGLFLSGIAGLDSLDALGITHVLSVVNGAPPDSPLLASRQTLHIDVADDSEANLLQHLPTATEYISSALKTSPASRVLVHCAQGVSRSAAVVAAHMIRSLGIDPEAALAAIRRRCPEASPNAGFMHQLHLWHCMGGALDTSYIPYKRFLAEQAAAQFHMKGFINLDGLAQPHAGDGSAGAVLYRCRKCRTLVATAENVIETAGPGSNGFAWRKRDKVQRASHGGEDAAAAGTGGIFVEPLRWMEDAVGGAKGIQGKLYCPKHGCDARLGAFNWSGMQNSAGAWMTPGFQLHLSKLDIEDPKSFERAQTGASTLGIRRPKILASSPAAAAATGPTAAASVSTHGAVPASDSHAPFPTTSMHFDGFTHLILDCDGVMVDSERPSCESLRRAILAATGFDIPHSFPEDFQPVFGMDVRSCVEYYRLRFNKTGEWGEDDATLAAKVSDTKEGIYREMTQGGVQAFEGVRELVQSARALGMGVAVASSGSPEKIAHNLGSSGLGDLVPQELIVSAKYVARGKPAPDVYLEALRRLGCEDASRAVVVEDAVNGLAAAREAGCFTVGVATSLPVEALQGHADVVVEELKNIDLKALQRPKLGTV